MRPRSRIAFKASIKARSTMLAIEVRAQRAASEGRKIPSSDAKLLEKPWRS